MAQADWGEPSTLNPLKRSNFTLAKANEELYNEATPEERKDLLRLHINYLIYTHDGTQLALF